MKTAFDGARYAVGATDTLKGTGVWSFIKADRGADKTPASKSKAAKKPTKVSLGKKKGTRLTDRSCFALRERACRRDREN